MDVSIKKARIELFLLLGLYIIILPRVYMDYDMGYWRDWALYIFRHGVGRVYDSGTNYLPISVYSMYIFDLLQGSEKNIIENINSIKIIFVVFDFLPLIVLCCFRQKLFPYPIPYFYLLFNIAYVFNAMVWGQIDSAYTNFGFLAIITSLFYPVAGGLLYILALNSKPHAIEFLPIMVFILFYSVRNYKTLLLVLAASLTLQIILIVPFLKYGGLEKLIYISTHAVDLYNKLSICAFNIWYLIQSGNPYFINDKDVFFILSYKSFGIIMFAVSSLLVLIPLVKQVLHIRKNNIKPGEYFYKVLFLSTGLLSLFFFYFNAQMHERYAHPIIIFFFFYSIVAKDYKLYILASIPYFLSLDKCFTDYLPVIHYKFIFASKVIALWYTATVLLGSYTYYQLIAKGKQELVRES